MKVVTVVLPILIQSMVCIESRSFENCENSDSGNLVTIVKILNVVIGVGDLTRVTESRDDEFPFVGRLRSQDGSYGCTGSILKGNRVVLTAGHCVDPLGSSPFFVLSRDKVGSVSSPLELIARGNDWACYRVARSISFSGPYPVVASIEEKDLKGVRVLGIGYPLQGAERLNEKFVVDRDCLILGPTFPERKLLSNCFSRAGMSGGPIGIWKDDGFHLIGVRSGPQWGLIPKIFNQVGTIETPSSFFGDECFKNH